MTIDASIPLGIRPMQLPDPINQLARVLGIQGLQQRQAMDTMQMRDSMDEREQKRNFLASIPELNGQVQPGGNPMNALMARGVRAGVIPIAEYIKAQQPKDLYNKVDPKDFTPESLQAFQASGDHTKLVPVRKSEFVNGQAVNPYATQPGTVIPKQSDPASDLLIPGPNGTMVPNAPLVGVRKDIARSGASNVSVNTGQKGLDNELKIRSDFRSEPIYKAHQEVQSAHSQITAALKQASPAGDLAGATKIMKILDPGSVVRESELGMAMAATGALDRLQYYATNVINGTKLNPKQRQDFQQLADKLYAESAKQYNSKRGEYAGFATDYNLNADRIVGPAITSPRLPTSSAPVGAPAAGPSVDDLLKKYGG